MANPTTNYGFVLPTPTDLVTDLPADFEVALQGVDTQMKTNADAAIAKTIVDAKGDLIAATGADAVSRLAVGTNNQILVADSTTATGLKWAAPTGGEANWTLLNSGGTALTAAQTITVSGISGKDKILVLLDLAGSASQTFVGVRLNTDSGSNYFLQGWEYNSTSSYAATNMGRFGGSKSVIDVGRSGGNNEVVTGFVTITGCNSSGVKQFIAGGSGSGGTNHRAYGTSGVYNSATVISSISVFSSVGNFNSGTVYVYTSV
jgi:hypothetical protein